MGSPLTALDSLVQPRATENRVRQLPACVYPLTTTSLPLFEEWPSIPSSVLQEKQAAPTQGNFGKEWTHQKQDNVLKGATSKRIWTLAIQRSRGAKRFQKTHHFQRIKYQQRP